MATNAKPRVLVVDDDADFTTLLKMILEADGFAVTTAANGEEALALVRAVPPDLVTLDIQMPRKTGVVFYRQMKSDGSLRSIPVIVISGLLGVGEDSFIERFFDVDGLPAPEAYLDKSVDKKKVLALVREKLASGRGKRQVA